MVVPRVDTAQYGVETPTWGSQTQRHPGRISPIPQSELRPCTYNSNKPETKTVPPRADTSPHDVETPSPLGPLANCGLAGVRRASASGGG